MRGAVAALALLAAGAAPDPFAGLPNVHFAWRPIAGATVPELAAALEASADHPAQGGSSYGATRWAIHWHWRGRGPGAACRVQSVEMTFDARVTLPRLADPAALDEATRARWAAFAAAIATHEAGHVRRAWRGVPAVRAAILGAACDDADAVGHAAVHRIEAAQQAYDRLTRNGAAQGARFP